jgi:hypothetical protein
MKRKIYGKMTNFTTGLHKSPPLMCGHVIPPVLSCIPHHL